MKIYVLGRVDSFNRLEDIKLYKNKCDAEEDLRRMLMVGCLYSKSDFKIMEHDLNESVSDYATLFVDLPVDGKKHQPCKFIFNSISHKKILPEREYGPYPHIQFSIKYDEYKDLTDDEIEKYGFALARKIDNTVIDALKYIRCDLRPHITRTNFNPYNTAYQLDVISTQIFNNEAFNNALNPDLNTKYALNNLLALLSDKLKGTLENVLATAVNTFITDVELERINQDILCKLNGDSFFCRWDFSKNPSLIPVLLDIVKYS